jgi:hypothetical protein
MFLKINEKIYFNEKILFYFIYKKLYVKIYLKINKYPYKNI